MISTWRHRYRGRDRLREIVDRIVRTADVRDGGGVRLMRVAVDARTFACVVQKASASVQTLGFVAGRIDRPPPAGRLSALMHRHLVLFGEREDRCAARRWVRRLSAASPRAHLIVMRAEPDAGSPAPSTAGGSTCGAGWGRHAASVAREAERWLTAGAMQPAEAALQSLATEAALTHQRLPARAHRVRTRILLWRSRFGRHTMNLLHGMTSLLEVVQDAVDEHSALRHGCSWVREHAGADAAGILAADAPEVIVGEGVEASDLEEPDVRAAMSGGRGGTITEGARAVAIAPMRYRGATIGFAFARGARDAVESLDGAARALASACAPALRAKLDGLAVVAASQTLVPELLGRSPSIRTLREAIARAAATTFPVLIEGESGTGKELVARAVHRLSARRDRRFAALNCAALSDELVESELFGYTRGAFTGAVNNRPGLFEETHGSTLFLDEVAELSPRAQAKLLRVLQEREIRRVGEHVARPVDVRVVAATNVPLAQAAVTGKFREDLLFRLAVVRIRVPPLRDRIEDVPLLAHAFWRAMAHEMRKQAVLGPDAVAALCRHHWSGNVRELQNVVAALSVAAPMRGRLTARHVEHVLAGYAAVSNEPVEVTLDLARAALERRMIAAALARHRGRRVLAARELGVSRQGLAKAMKRLGFDHPRLKARASACGRDLPQAK